MVMSPLPPMTTIFMIASLIFDLAHFEPAGRTPSAGCFPARGINVGSPRPRDGTSGGRSSPVGCGKPQIEFLTSHIRTKRASSKSPKCAWCGRTGLSSGRGQRRWWLKVPRGRRSLRIVIIENWRELPISISRGCREVYSDRETNPKVACCERRRLEDAG